MQQYKHGCKQEADLLKCYKRRNYGYVDLVTVQGMSYNSP
jgi:hypothetical protein